MAEPTDAELAAKVEALLPTVDLQTMGVKQFMKILSKEFGGIDLKPRKSFIKEALTEAINNSNQNDEESEEEDEDDDDSEEEDDEEEEETSKPKKKTKGKGKGSGGLNAKKLISDKLANFLGKGSHMSRPEIVSSLWDYIRENDLQNPSDKREIILDEDMKNVFGCDTFTMFSMNKYIGAHIDPFKPVDLTPSTPKANKKRKAAPSSKGSGKKRKAGTQPPYRLSDQLQKVVGVSILPRPQVVSKIWEYIKANNLQNEQDKREIICDDLLSDVMKRQKVSMFKMNQLITPHLIEKVDRSEYVHDDDEDSD